MGGVAIHLVLLEGSLRSSFEPCPGPALLSTMSPTVTAVLEPRSSVSADSSNIGCWALLLNSCCAPGPEGVGPGSSIDSVLLDRNSA